MAEKKMITGTTVSGFEYSINPVIFDDMEFIEDIAEVETNGTKIVSLVKRLLGEEQKKALYEFCRAGDGHVSKNKVVEILTQIMQSAPKN